MSTASVLSRVEDVLMKYLRKLTPFARKLMLLYTSGQQFEQAERGIVHTILGFAGRLYGFSQVAESRALKLFRALARKVIALQASLEDAVSFASLYMNLLFVVAVLLMVIAAWSFKP